MICLFVLLIDKWHRPLSLKVAVSHQTEFVWFINTGKRAGAPYLSILRCKLDHVNLAVHCVTGTLVNIPSISRAYTETLNKKSDIPLALPSRNLIHPKEQHGRPFPAKPSSGSDAFDRLNRRRQDQRDFETA